MFFKKSLILFFFNFVISFFFCLSVYINSHLIIFSPKARDKSAAKKHNLFSYPKALLSGRLLCALIPGGMILTSVIITPYGNRTTSTFVNYSRKNIHTELWRLHKNINQQQDGPRKDIRYLLLNKQFILGLFISILCFSKWQLYYTDRQESHFYKCI